jgi:hypothetical protein
VLKEPSTVEVRPADGRAPFEANSYVIEQGTDRMLMLYWYQGRGRAVASEYVDKVYTFFYSIRLRRSEGAMVRGDGWSLFVKLDEDTLKSIAHITKGNYFRASTADELKKAYRDLNTKLVLERKDVELTFAFVAISALLLVLSAALSLLWFGRAP